MKLYDLNARKKRPAPIEDARAEPDLGVIAKPDNFIPTAFAVGMVCVVLALTFGACVAGPMLSKWMVMP